MSYNSKSRRKQSFFTRIPLYGDSGGPPTRKRLARYIRWTYQFWPQGSFRESLCVLLFHYIRALLPHGKLFRDGFYLCTEPDEFPQIDLFNVMSQSEEESNGLEMRSSFF